MLNRSHPHGCPVFEHRIWNLWIVPSESGIKCLSRYRQVGIGIAYRRSAVKEGTGWEKTQVSIGIICCEGERVSVAGASNDINESEAVPRHRARKCHRWTERREVKNDPRKCQARKPARLRPRTELTNPEIGAADGRSKHLGIADAGRRDGCSRLLQCRKCAESCRSVSTPYCGFWIRFFFAIGFDLEDNEGRAFSCWSGPHN